MSLIRLHRGLNLMSRCRQVRTFGEQILSLTVARVGRRASVAIRCRRRGRKHVVANFAFGFGIGGGGLGIVTGIRTSRNSVFAVRKLGSGRLKHVTHGPDFVTSCGSLIDSADPTNRSVGV